MEAGAEVGADAGVGAGTEQEGYPYLGNPAPDVQGQVPTAEADEAEETAVREP